MIAVVIPCYQGHATIAKTVNGIPFSWVDRIYVVDDGSIPPITYDTLGEFASVPRVMGSVPGAILLSHDRNRGVGQAMMTGYEVAVANGADIVVKMDADGQMNPKYLRALTNPLVAGIADYTKGYRNWGLEKMPRARYWGMRGLSWWLGAPDCVNGYTAITRRAINRLDFSRLDPRYGWEITMLLEARRLGLRVKHVPMPYIPGAGGSHLSPWECLRRFPWLLWRYRSRIKI